MDYISTHILEAYVNCLGIGSLMSTLQRRRKVPQALESFQRKKIVCLVLWRGHEVLPRGTEGEWEKSHMDKNLHSARSSYTKRGLISWYLSCESRAWSSLKPAMAKLLLPCAGVVVETRWAPFGDDKAAGYGHGRVVSCWRWLWW